MADFEDEDEEDEEDGPMGNLSGSDDSHCILCGVCGGLRLFVDDLLIGLVCDEVYNGLCTDFVQPLPSLVVRTGGGECRHGTWTTGVPVVCVIWMEGIL